MEIQYSEIYESKNACEVEILIADEEDLESASSYIEMKISLPKKKNPLIAEVQKEALVFARDLINEKIKETESRETEGI
ncbi:hypothetical protein MNBD_NITROSPIRAE01-740 [hydrothermal vent metagenome]|uniref:Uncharacterized protein n=1 Tax=hydrothermal vent metagenome TaxID=652676 RepID=A0A3B1CVH0_9ZZZZ